MDAAKTESPRERTLGTAALGRDRFQVRGWRTGTGWVRVEPPDKDAFVRDGWILDLDIATLTAIDARRLFTRVEVLDATGEVLVMVDSRGASVPHRTPERIPANALPFLAAVLRVELQSAQATHFTDASGGQEP
jgi:hypothetical protein